MTSRAVNGAIEQYLPSSLTDPTRKSYVSLLRSLWVNGLGRPLHQLLTWDWQADEDAIAWHGHWTYMFYHQLTEYIDSLEKDTTKRCFYNVIHVSWHDVPHWQEVTRKRIRDLNGKIAKVENWQQRDAKEEMYGMTHDELLEAVQQLHAEVLLLPCVVENRPMTELETFTDYTTLFNWVALACYVLQPPLRGEWGNMYLFDRSLNDRNTYNWQTGVLSIVKDKVSERSGRALIKVSQELQDVISFSLFLYPKRKYVIPSNNISGDKPHSYFPMFLRLIKHPYTGDIMNQGIQLLRSSYITWFYDRPGVTIADKKQLATMMRHTWQTAELCYKKVILDEDFALDY